MSVQLVNLSGFSWGITSDELGINCAKLTLEVEPEINEWVPGIQGQARGKVVGDPMGKLAMEGEITDVSVGAMAAVVQTAFVPVNPMNFFGRSAGGFYFDRGTVDRERGILRKMTADFSSRFNVP